MIGALLLASLSPPIAEAKVEPAEFRRKVEYQHVCITEVLPETGFRELGRLDLQRGENIAEIKLASNGPRHHFENGMVERVDTQDFDDGVALIVHVTGERQGQPAKLVIRDEHRRYRHITAALTQGELKREYRCDPTVRPPQQ